MKQRVGVARALVVEPEVLFMDEPFSALDVLTAETLRGELLELWLGHKIPTRAIFIVTHNIEEAVVLADRIIVLGRNPAHIHADFAVEIPHPRDRKSAHFIELVDSIYRILTRPDHKDAAAPLRTFGPGKEVRPKILMLPHTRPGGLAGLVEILVDQGGRVDLHRLADELSLEVDALLPSVDTAALLGFLRVEEGDVTITPEGQAFAQGDIQARKTIFRKAALANVPLLRQIEQALKAKSNRTLNEEFFRDLLDQHFGEDESRRQLETAIQWGRYSGIFDYDAATAKLRLTESQRSRAGSSSLECTGYAASAYREAARGLALELGISHRYRRFLICFCGDFWGVCDWPFLAWPGPSAGADFADSPRPSSLPLLLSRSSRRRLRADPVCY